MHTFVDESDESSSSDNAAERQPSRVDRQHTQVATKTRNGKAPVRPRSASASTAVRQTPRAVATPAARSSHSMGHRPSRCDQTIIDLTGADDVEMQAETPSSGVKNTSDLAIAPVQVVKRRKTQQHLKTALGTSRRSTSVVRRTALPPSYAAVLLLHSRGYQPTPSSAITHIVDLCLSYLGDAMRVGAGAKLWKQLANADNAHKVHGQRLVHTWRTLQASSSSVSIPSSASAPVVSTVGNVGLWRMPTNMAECIFLDKMRQTFQPSTIRRKPRRKQPRYTIQGHHMKEFKPRKRARTEPTPKAVVAVAVAPTPPPTAVVEDATDVVCTHAHVSGSNPSLPDGWTYAPLPTPLTRVQPLANLSRDQIALHVETLRCDSRLTRFRRLVPLLTRLMEHARNTKGLFNAPVDPVALDLPTYNDIIARPMDLGTIKKTLDAGKYVSLDAFAADVRLVFENAMLFNGKDHWVHGNAKLLRQCFDDLWVAELVKAGADGEKAAAHACSVCAGHTCALCDDGCLELTLPHYQCFGNCGTVFRKGMSYYVTRDGTRMWCMKCRNRGMKEEKTKRDEDEGGSSNYLRGAARALWPTAAEMAPLLSKKKCEVDVEPWVRCGSCDRWMHQVCALFNAVEDAYASPPTSSSNAFTCPLCELAAKQTSTTPSIDCRSLPESPLSIFLEQRLRAAIPTGDADALYVRESTFANHKFFMPPSIVEAFKMNADALRAACPDAASEARELPVRVSFATKSIFLFQKQQGVDVCLFAMYVQEYNDDCELVENRRSAYLAYIDSVRYLQPPSIRTLVYHRVLLGYFDYARHHGLDRIHIWSCPPTRSQSYVFWCHPTFQKTPSVDHLRAWYKRVLQKAQDEHIIDGYTTLYERYLAPLQSKYAAKAAKAPELPPPPTTPSDKSAAITTRRVSTNTLLTDKDEYLWPAPLPFFDGDIVPSELDRVIRQQKSKKRKKIWAADAPLYDDDGLHRMRDTFTSFLSAMKIVKDDLLVVDLAPPTAPLVIPSLSSPPRSMMMPAFIGSRFSFHQLSLRASYQFDSLRRAKHSTMMLLHHMLNASVPQVNVFCAECALLLTHAVYWRCTTCAEYALCDWCHLCHGDQHAHRLERDETTSRADDHLSLGL
ncbi:hypothetical protein SDRG_00427 [Saprolegnia diclina VS20]|uniref:histone acetyltransferase n=1 Tax=Saprolegnia diclina (strain VS20) TaxID=1156394 RepID=T0R8A1_SAPDV|nr:hypothetical protein SDRG_00427 [Saprolegnia diclina VS20]EQC42700.1 hypothetical protein SDRG_00427 [Saprolegnia diclina VS20]|eukprot:XP_008604123.1 hypothetical protein SDRG_00427 [Saprolegnia diclina VS20]